MSHKSHSKISKGVYWTIINKLSGIIVQLISLTVLARYIKPQEFALMGIALFFMNIANLMIDSGMGGSLVGKKQISDRDYSTLFIYNLGVSCFLAVCLFFLSSLISEFYATPGLVSIIKVISFQLLVISIGKVHNIILIRELRFKELGIVAVMSQLVSVLVAIFLAIRGYGIWALIAQNFINIILTVLLQFFYCRYIPKLSFDLTSFKEQWIFGSYLFIASLIQLLTTNIYQLIFPKISSLKFSGYYTQASKLQMLPITTAASIIDLATFPVLAQNRDSENFLDMCRFLARLVYLLVFSLLFVLFLFSKQFLLFLLGPEWVDASDVLRILLCSAIFLLVQVQIRNVLKSIYETQLIFKIEIVKSIIVFICLLLGFFFDENFFLYTIPCASFASMVYNISTLSKVSSYKWNLQVLDILKPFFYCLLVAVLVYLLQIIVDCNNFVFLIIKSLSFYVLLMIVVYLCKDNDMKKILAHYGFKFI